MMDLKWNDYFKELSFKENPRYFKRSRLLLHFKRYTWHECFINNSIFSSKGFLLSSIELSRLNIKTNILFK